MPDQVHVEVKGRHIYGPAYLLYRELYTCENTDEELGAVIARLSAEDEPDIHWAGDCADHDLKGIATLRKYTSGMLRKATKSTTIEKARTIIDAFTRDNIYLIQNCTHHVIDGEVIHGKHPAFTSESVPASTEEEIPVWRWQDSGKKEEPVKEFDHGIDAMSYLLNTFPLDKSAGVVKIKGRTVVRS